MSDDARDGEISGETSGGIDDDTEWPPPPPGLEAAFESAIQADVALSSDDLDAADRHLADARAALVAAPPEVRSLPAAAAIWADVARVKGWIARKRGDCAAARRWFEMAAVRRRDVLNRAPDAFRAVPDAIDALSRLAIEETTAGDIERGESCFAAAFEIGVRAWRRGDRSRSTTMSMRESAEARMGCAVGPGGRAAELPAAEAGLTWFRACRAAAPDDAGVVDALVRMAIQVGQLRVESGRVTEGMADLDEAVALARTEFDPWSLPWVLVARAEAAASLGRREAATADLLEARSRFRAAAAAHPDHPWGATGEQEWEEATRHCGLELPEE